MKRFTLILSLLVAMVTTAMAQTTYEQKIPHALYKVTALNEAGTSGNEGGVAFIQDNDPMTFYHSNWSSSYEGGSGKKGQDGLQAFMIEMPETVADITKLTYAGRSDNNASGWAKKVRIYFYETLPDGLTTDLASMSRDDKNTKLGQESTILGTPVFNNNEANTWEADKALKTITFDTKQKAKYVLFVMDEGQDGWLTCADFNIYYSITLDEGVSISEVEQDKPYYLKITNINNASEDRYVDILTPYNDASGATIGYSTTPVATYFRLVKGVYHIHAMPNSEIALDNTFLGISKWCATPKASAPANYYVEYNADGTLVLLQDSYDGDSDRARCYLGGDAIIGGGKKIFTDNFKSNAIKIQLVPLTDVEAAKHKANMILARTGAGYPVESSEARTALQSAIDAADATVDSIEAAIATYKAVTDVVSPEAGKVYRIVSAYTGYANNLARKAVYSDVNNSTLKWMEYDNNATNQMWVVQECNAEDRAISIMNLNDAMYPQSSAFGAAVKSLNSYNECSYDILALGQFRIKANKLQGMHTNGHGNGTGNSGDIINYNTEKDGASAWYLQEVTVTKEMLGKLIQNVEAAYANFALIESEGKETLQGAVSSAKEVYGTENGDYAAAFATLSKALTSVEDMRYVDEAFLYLKSKEGKDGVPQYMYSTDDNKLSASADKTIKSIIKLKKANNGTYYIQTGNGLYSQNVAQSTQVALGAAPVEYTIRSLDADYYVLRPTASTGNYQFMHQDGSSNVVGWETGGGNTHWSIELLSEEELANIYDVEINVIPGVTATVTYNGEYAGHKAVKNDGGFYYFENTPAESDFAVDGVGDVPSKASIGDKKISIVAGYPADKMYTLCCNKGNSYARYHSGATLSANDNTNMLTYEGTCRYESLFYIEEGTGDYEGYYTIRPVAAPDKYVYSLKTADEDSKVAVGEKPSDGLKSAYYWKISSFGSTPANITPYDDYKGTDSEGNETTEPAGNFGWNKRGSYNGYNHIGYWKGGNNYVDNKWTVLTVEETFIPDEYTTDDSTVGYHTYASVKPSLDAIEYMTPANLEVLKSAVYNEVVAPAQGAYYRLQNVASNNYMSGNKTDITLLTEGAEAVSTVFYLAEGNMLLSYNSGQYLNCYGKNYVTIGQTPNNTKFGFAYGGPQENVLTYHSNGAWTYGADSDGAGLDKGDDAPNHNGYNWTFTKVSSLPVTISAAGYSTLYAPVALQVPEGVKAYTVTINGEWATLNEIAGGVISANTGVVIGGTDGEKAAADTYNFAIVDDVEAVESDLEGTVAATYVEEDAYVLGIVDNVVGFYKATKNQLGNTAWKNNSHKAYLPKPEGTEGVASYSFRFGEGTTGIDEITDNRVQSTGIYDLTGRRVENPSNGIYIINGVKVLVK